MGFRPTQLFDAPAIERLAQDPQISRFIYLDFPIPKDGGKQLALEAIRSRYEGRAFAFSIFVNRKLAGMATIDRIDWEQSSGHLFYWLDVPYWNQGVGSWAVGQLIQWAQQQTGRQRLTVLYANCLAENAPSIHVLRKNGFDEVEKFIGSGDHGGKFAGRRWVLFSRSLQLNLATSPNLGKPATKLSTSEIRPEHV